MGLRVKYNLKPSRGQRNQLNSDNLIEMRSGLSVLRSSSIIAFFSDLNRCST